MAGDALGQIASTSLAGAMLVIALLALRAKDRELSDEKAERIKDARDHLQLIMKLQEQVILAVNKLSDLVEIWDERDRQRTADDRHRNSPYRDPPVAPPKGGTSR